MTTETSTGEPDRIIIIDSAVSEKEEKAKINRLKQWLEGNYEDGTPHEE